MHQTANQLDVLVIGKEDRVWLTCEDPDGFWLDGRDGRPEPFSITPSGFAPAGAGVSALLRPDGQMEAYAVSQGRITSFRQLPTFLNEATALGTNIVYLWDYWEGSDAAGCLTIGTRVTTFARRSRRKGRTDRRHRRDR